MLYRMVIAIVLLSSFALWQGCGQSDFNDSEVNRSVTQADDDSSNNSNDDDSSDKTAPTVSSTSPADSESSVAANTDISITFSESMDATSITTNAGNNSCSGTLQVSSNDFSTCVMMSEEPDASNSKQRYTLKPASDLSYSTTYKIRVTTGVKDSAGNALASQYTQTNGFTIGTNTDNTTEKEWITKASIPIAINSAPGSAVIGTKIYLIAGESQYTADNRLQIYDTTNNSWSTGANTNTIKPYVYNSS